jgi:tape measure domain-containing protein
MAASTDTLLKIRAIAEGGDQIAKLAKEIEGVGKEFGKAKAPNTAFNQSLSQTASIAAGIGLDRLRQQIFDYGGTALLAGEQSYLLERRIKALASANGEAARVSAFAAESAQRYGMSQNQAAESVANLYGRLRPMGLSLQEIETTYVGVSNAAKLAGLSAFDTQEAFRQLAQAMGSGRLQGDEFRSIMERMPQIGVAIAAAFNKIAESKGLKQISRETADSMVKELEEGEKRQIQVVRDGIKAKIREVDYGEKQQIDAVRRGIDKRIEEAQRETDEVLREINRRYQREEQLLADKYQDQEDADARASQKEMEGLNNSIDERYDAIKKGIDREFDEQRRSVEQANDLAEEQKRQILYNIEDQKEFRLRAIRDAQDEEEQALRDSFDRQRIDRNRALRDQQQQERYAIEDRQREEVDRQNAALKQKTDILNQEGEERMQIIKEQADNEKEAIKASEDEKIAAIKEATDKAQAAVLASVRVTVADLKRLSSEGKITTEVMAKAMEELAKIKPPPPTALDMFRAATEDLNREIGDNLLPILMPFIEGLESLLKGLQSLPEPIQGVIVVVGLLTGGILALGIALAPLVFVLNSVAIAFGILGSIGLGATIAGWLGALGPFVTGFTAALGGLLIWVGTTFIPGLLAFFSGPVGWTVLAVAAVVAMAVAFREPLMQWWTWLTGEWLPGVTQSWSDWVATLLARFAEIPSGLQIIAQQIVEGLTMAFQNWWTWLTEQWLPGVLQAWESLAQGVQSLRDRIVSSFSNISEGIKSALDKSKNWLKAFWDYGVSLFSYFGALISKPFVIGINSMVDAVNYVTTVAANAINSFIAGINRMVAAVNVISARIGAPALSYLPTIQTFTIPKLDVPEVKLPKGFQLPKGMPSFATGAYVKRPMVAEIGDVAGGEYVLRPDQLVPAAANYVRGARGGDVLSSMSAAPAGAVEVSVNLQTGPVQMMPNGEPGVSLDIVAAMIESGIGQALDQIASAPGRAAMGF